MKTRHLTFALALAFCLLAMPLAAAESAQPTADEKAQQRADALYKEGQYSEALETYRNLARKGDYFSQYRTSYMYLQGEGTDQDLPEAFAWAFLAAEYGEPQLEQYFNEVMALVPENQREAAQARAESHMNQWGRMALAKEASREAKDKMRKCTGSRLGTRCDEVYAVQMPKFWNVAPGVGDGSDGGSGAPSGTVAGTPMGAGGERRDAEYYQELREYKAELDTYINQETGTVEVIEVPTAEPTPPAAAPDGAGSDEDGR